MAVVQESIEDRGSHHTVAEHRAPFAHRAVAYELRQPAKDAPVIDAMKRLSAQYPRYGYRRIRIFLRREGMVMSPARTERL